MPEPHVNFKHEQPAVNGLGYGDKCVPHEKDVSISPKLIVVDVKMEVPSVQQDREEYPWEGEEEQINKPSPLIPNLEVIELVEVLKVNVISI